MFGSGMKWLPLASYKNDEEEERRRKALTTQTAGRPSLTSHVPILKQLEDMLIQKISPQRAEPQTHVVRPGDTLWGMAEQYLPGGGPQWPDIRDMNIQTLQEGLERFPKDDPRRKKELGHWIFPGQEFQLPMPGREPEPEPEPEPTGLMEEIRRLIENPPKRFSEGDPVMAKGRETLPEAPASPTVRLEGDEGIKHPLSAESIEQDPFVQMGMAAGGEAGREKIAATGKKMGSYLETIGLSLSSGSGHVLGSLLNIPRAVLKLSATMWDWLMPDSFYKIEDDAILNAYDKMLDKHKQDVYETTDKILQEKDMSKVEEFLGMGFRQFRKW